MHITVYHVTDNPDDRLVSEDDLYERNDRDYDCFRQIEPEEWDCPVEGSLDEFKNALGDNVTIDKVTGFCEGEITIHFKGIDGIFREYHDKFLEELEKLRNTTFEDFKTKSHGFVCAWCGLNANIDFEPITTCDSYGNITALSNLIRRHMHYGDSVKLYVLGAFDVHV